MNKFIILIPVLLFAIIFSPSTSLGHGVGHDHEDSVRNKANSPIDRLIESYMAKSGKEPDDYYYYAKLGELYIQKGREEGGIENYIRAQQALMKAVELNPDDYTVYLHLGRVSTFKHDFHRTLELAKNAIELRPDKAATYALQGDAYLELGMYEEALKAYALTLYLDPGFDSYTRVSRMRFLVGDTQGAVKAMEQAIDSARRLDLPEENMAWAEVIPAPPDRTACSGLSS